MTISLYQDSAAPIDARADDLLRQMTLDEKLAQLGCLWSTALVREGRFDPDRAVALMPHGIGQITRIGAATGLRPRDSARLMNAIQKVAVERTRRGIPIFVHEESVGGFCHRDATVFPQALGLAATWDPGLIPLPTLATMSRRGARTAAGKGLRACLWGSGATVVPAAEGRSTNAVTHTQVCGSAHEVDRQSH